MRRLKEKKGEGRREQRRGWDGRGGEMRGEEERRRGGERREERGEGLFFLATIMLSN